MKKIGLFGGTFDPWTNAHQAIVETVLNKNIVDFVTILPTIVDYHREGKDKWLDDFEKFSVIYEFLKHGIFQDRIFMDFQEIRMKNCKILSEDEVKKWRFINTLERVENLYKNSDSKENVEFYTIIGTDSLKNFKTWHRWKDILNKSKLVCVTGRNGDSVETDIEYIPVSIPKKFSSISSTDIRKRFHNMNDYLTSIFGGQK